jgi:acetyltransferase-like isoleucine patch superfamily enzyme
MAILPFTAKFLGLQISTGFNIRVGPHSYGHPRILWNEAQRTQYSLEIGDYCSIAEGVVIYVGAQGRHPIDFVSSYPLGMIFPSADGPRKRSRINDRDLNVTIGSDVWLGREALILAGVKIGHGAVIGARALVTKDVAPYAIMGGVPARPIGTRFKPNIVRALLELAWWDLDPKIIAANVDAFMTPDIEIFIQILQGVKSQSQVTPSKLGSH